MPTYDYKCRACEHRFEIQQSFTDDALTECPECGGELRKVFAAPGISFKGSGFYKNDSKTSKTRAATKGSDSGSSSDTSSSDTSSDSSSSDSSSKGTGSSDAGSSKETSTKATTGSSTTTPASTSP